MKERIFLSTVRLFSVEPEVYIPLEMPVNKKPKYECDSFTTIRSIHLTNSFVKFLNDQCDYAADALSNP